MQALIKHEYAWKKSEICKKEEELQRDKMRKESKWRPPPYPENEHYLESVGQAEKLGRSNRVITKVQKRKVD